MIRVSVLGHEAFPQSFSSIFLSECIDTGYYSVEGIVLHVWTVHHSKRKHCPGFSSGDTTNLCERDFEIVQAFNFISYISPTDSVDDDLRDLPDTDTCDFSVDGSDENGHGRKRPRVMRGNTMRNRAQRIESAWEGWEKPLIKPGDIVAMLGPPSRTTSPTADSGARLFAVNRFWTERGERSRHIFWVSGGIDSFDAFPREVCSPLSTQTSQSYRNVVSVLVKRIHSGSRGPQKSVPVSSTGTLHSGEKYLSTDSYFIGMASKFRQVSRRPAKVSI